MRFEFPLAFLLLVFTPLLLELTSASLIPFRKRRKNSIKFSSPVDITSIAPSTRTTLRTPILSLLKAGSFVLLVTALARPQYGHQFSQTDASGRDIILALDVSGSMQALDFFIDNKRVNRLTALQTVVKEFINNRPGDRIGLVVFGDQAFTQCPLTLDHDVLNEFVDNMEVGMAGQGTAIGTSIAISLKQIKEIESDSKVLVLVTDGKSNSGAISPKEAGNIAHKLGVKIHAIGVGGNGYAPFPVPGFFGRTTLVDRKMEFDEQTLIGIANVTGGQYFNAKNTEGLVEVYSQIDKLETREDKTFEYIDYEERFYYPLLVGLVLFVMHVGLSSTVFLTIP